MGVLAQPNNGEMEMQSKGCVRQQLSVSPSPYRVQIAQRVVAQAFGVTVGEIRASTRRQPHVALARQIAMYLSHVVFKMSLAQVAEAFGRHRSTASHALHLVENLRDDPQLDRTVGYLEALLRGSAGHCS